MAIALGLEVLYLIMSGAITGKQRLRERLMTVYAEVLSKSSKFQLPTRNTCNETGSGGGAGAKKAKAWEQIAVADTRKDLLGTALPATALPVADESETGKPESKAGDRGAGD